MKYNSSEFLFDLQAAGRNSFILDEMAKSLGVSHKSAKEILARLAKNKRIVSLTTGLYAVVHPSERQSGIRPLHVIDTLMQHRKVAYYVGLLSAADYWGAAHQKPMSLQVLVPQQMKMRKQSVFGVSLHVKKEFPKAGIVKAATETGLFNISSPTLTALDVVTYESVCGGLENVFLVVQALVPKITTTELNLLISTYRPITSIQRLGYLLQLAKAPKAVTQTMEKYIAKQRPPVVPLSTSSGRLGKTNTKWRIILNFKIETQHDL